jgi:hypothetical protein
MMAGIKAEGGTSIHSIKGPFRIVSCTGCPQEIALFMPPASCTLENEPLSCVG